MIRNPHCGVGTRNRIRKISQAISDVRGSGLHRKKGEDKLKQSTSLGMRGLQAERVGMGEQGEDGPAGSRETLIRPL